MIRPRLALLVLAVAVPCVSLAYGGDPAPTEKARVESLERLETEIRKAPDSTKRQKAALRYLDEVQKAGDLEKSLPLTEAESELCRVLAAEKSVRAGPYGRHVGHHVIVLAPEGGLASAEAPRLLATLDTAFVLIEDLDGSSFERARHRRLLVVFSPDHPAGGAQTLEGVVFAGLGILGPPVNDQVLFHEFGHEHFAAPNLRPRFENFNEIWPELGRQYVLWHLGRQQEFEENRARYLKAYRERYLAPGLPLEHLEPYDTGAGLLQTILDTLRRGDAYDFEPLRAFFRRALKVPAQTDSFHQRQEVLGCCLVREMGLPVRNVLQEARFDLPDDLEGLDAEIREAAPLFADLRARLSQNDLKGGLAVAEKLNALRRPGAWASQARTALAAFLAARSETEAARDQLERGGHLLQWHVLGPFPNPRGAGMQTAYPPESGVDLAAEVAGSSAPLRWSPASGNSITGYVDLATLVSPNEEVVVYAFTTIESPGEVEADLFTGSDDSLVAFVNGRQVTSRFFPRGCFVDNERARVRLRAGKNDVLLKVGNFWQGFGFICRVCSPTGSPLAAH